MMYKGKNFLTLSEHMKYMLNTEKLETSEIIDVVQKMWGTKYEDAMNIFLNVLNNEEKNE